MLPLQSSTFSSAGTWKYRSNRSVSKGGGTKFAVFPAVRLRVMTYNIKGHGSLFSRSHLEDIAEVIRSSNADVVGLQEVHRRTWKSRRRDQAADLAAATGMSLFFGPSFGDERRDYGNAVLTRGRIVEARVEPLPGGGEPRTVLASTIDLNGFRLHAYVTHLAAWGRFGARSRLLQAEAVAQIAEKSDLPFVLTGDFNSTPTSDELRVFHDGELVMSCFVEPRITYRATRQCLDYVFVDRGWTIRDAQILEHGPSDHWPVVAELERE